MKRKNQTSVQKEKDLIFKKMKEKAQKLNIPQNYLSKFHYTTENQEDNENGEEK